MCLGFSTEDTPASVEDVNPIQWLALRWNKLKSLEDSPRAVAVGIAVGIFFGFTPLVGLKTLLAISVAWLLRGNRLAAAVAVTLHDIILPLMPVIALGIRRRLLGVEPSSRTSALDRSGAPTAPERLAALVHISYGRSPSAARFVVFQHAGLRDVIRCHASLP
jgi:hypothetical protein